VNGTQNFDWNACTNNLLNAMKYANIMTLVFGLVLLTACQNTPTDDPEKLKQVLTSYFDGVKTKNTKEMIDVTTDDFLLYEGGKAWNNDSVFMNMKRNSPYTVEFVFDNFRTNVDSKSGHLTYEEHAHFIFRDTIKVDLNFLGSAAFRKSEGTWKMNFLSATKKYVPKGK
jgi:hypothetical protein